MTINCRSDSAGNISIKTLIKTRQLEHRGFLLRQLVLKMWSSDQQGQHYHHYHLETDYKCKFGAPTIDLVIQKLGVGPGHLCFNSPPGDSDAVSSLITLVLEVCKFHCQKKQEFTHMCSLMLITGALCL